MTVSTFASNVMISNGLHVTNQAEATADAGRPAPSRRQSAKVVRPASTRKGN